MGKKRLFALLLTLVYVMTAALQMAIPVNATQNNGTVWYDFEDEKLPGTATDLADDGFRVNGVAEVVSGGAHGSGYAAEVKATSQMHILVSGLQEFTTYQLSAWVKGGSAASILGLSDCDQNGNFIGIGGDVFARMKFTHINAGGWQKVTVDYTTGAGIGYVLIYAQNDGDATFLIDDISFKKISSAGIAPYKLGQTWGFEEGVLPGTADNLLDDGFKSTTGNIGCSVTPVAGGANGSSYALKVSGNQARIQMHIGGLEPNKKYKVTAWVKGEGTTGASVIGVADSNANDTHFAYKNGIVLQQGTEWQQISMDFTTGEGITYALLYAQNDTESSFLIDNISVTDPSISGIAPYQVGQTWEFEEGILPGNVNGITDDGFRVNGVAEVVAGGANSSGYAAKVHASSQMHMLIGVKPNTTYQLSAWVKGGSDISFFGLSDCDKDGNFIGVGDNVFARMKSTVINSSDWQKVTVDYTTGAGVSYVLVYAQNDGNSTFLMDNFSMKVIPSAGIAPYKVGQTWGFEEGVMPGTADNLLDDGFKSTAGDIGCTVVPVAGGANNSAYAMKVAGNQARFQMHIGGLKPNKTYTVTAWVKCADTIGTSVIGVADSNANDTHFGFKNCIILAKNAQWQKVSMDFTTGDNITYALVYAQNETDSSFLIDDISVTDPSGVAIAPYKVGQTWGFEEGLIPGTPLDLADDGFRVNGTAEISSGGANDSGYAAKVAETSQMHMLVEVKENTTYQLSAWVKGGSSTSILGLSDCDKNGNFIGVGGNIFARMKFTPINASGWQKITVDYTTGIGIKYVLIYAQNDGNSTFLIDDISMKEMPNAGIAPYKLGQTWGFEEGVLPGTADNLLDDGFRTTSGNIGCTVIPVAGGANGSKYAMKIAGNQGRMQLHIGGLEPNRTYLVTAWVKGEGTNGASVIGIADSNQNDTYFGYKNGVVIEKGTEWKKITMEYTTGEGITYALLYMQNDTDSAFLVDDIYLTGPITSGIAPYQVGQTWGFEEGLMPGTMTNVMDDGFRINGTAEIVAGGNNKSEYAVKVDKNSQMHILVGNLKPETTYQLSAWIKGGSKTSIFGLSDSDKDGNFIGVGSDIFARMKFTTIDNANWQKVTVEYTTGVGVNNVLVYAQNDGDATFLIDDFSMKEVLSAGIAPYKLGQTWGFEEGVLPGTTNSLLDDGFETTSGTIFVNGTVDVVAGGANGSGYAVQMTGADSKMFISVDGLKPNTLYMYTCYAKREGINSDHLCFVVANNDLTDVSWEIIDSNEWARYICFYRTGANETSMKLYLHNIEGAVSMVDDICVTEYTGANLMGPGWDFATGDYSQLGTPARIGGDGFELLGSGAKIVSGGVNGSNYSMQISGKDTGIHKMVTGLEPNTKYRLSAWVKCTSVSNDKSLPVVAIVGSNNRTEMNWGTEKWAGVPVGAWRKVNVDFTTGPDETFALVYIRTYDNASFRVGDIFLREYYTNRNSGLASYQLDALWDFEDGMVQGTEKNYKDDGFEILGCAYVVSPGANDSKYALELVGADSKVHVAVTGLKPNTLYKYTCYARSKGTGSDHLCFVVARNDLENSTWVRITGDEWAEYTCYYRTGADETSMLMYFHNIEGATSRIDDINITECTEENLLGPGWNFETGDYSEFGTPADIGGDGFEIFGTGTEIVNNGANGTEYALRISGMDTGMRKVVTGLKPSTTYTLTAWVKGETITNPSALPVIAIGDSDVWGRLKFGTEQWVGIFEGDWYQVTIEYTTGPKTTSAIVYAQNYSDCVYMIDELVLTKKVVGEKPNDVVETPSETEPAIDIPAETVENEQQSADNNIVWIIGGIAGLIALVCVAAVIAKRKARKNAA